MGACAMDVGMCSRHSGAQPGGGICAICLQEKLILLWRGEGNSNWDTEEFSVTPPLELLASSKSPPVDEPSPAEDALRDATAPSTHVYRDVTASTCFPVMFRVRHHLRRDDVHESSKEREKIDRSSRLAAVVDGASDREREFSCELKSIMKELSSLHEKKKFSKSEKAAARIRSGSVESGCFSGRRPQHEEVAADVTQRAATSAPQSGIEDATTVPAPPAETATTRRHNVLKAKAASIALDDDDEADDEDTGPRYAKSLQCFSALWPALANMKWARALVSPITSSNKIAPSKSDLLAKMVNGAVAGGKVVGGVGESEVRAESGRNCETSGESYELERGRDHFGGESGGGAAGVVAVLPPRWAQPVADEDGTVLELDKETKMRMEASRITVMTWLQSLPSPKTVHLTEHSHKDAIPDDLSLGNGVLEMCDEEEVFDIQSQEETAMTADNIKHETSFAVANDPPSEPPPQASATSFEFAIDPPSEPPQASATSFGFADDPPSEPPQASSAADIYAHMSSFGKFLRTPSEQIHAPTRMVDFEIAAQ